MALSSVCELERHWWVYILHCEKDTYYTGFTNNLRKRYRSHAEGTGSKYTRSFRPIGIAQCWRVFGEKSLAMQLERSIKSLSHQEKSELINNPSTLSTDERIQTTTAEERLSFFE